MKRHYSRLDLWLESAKYSLFIQDPRDWKLWEIVAWLLPAIMAVLIPLCVYALWRLGEIR